MKKFAMLSAMILTLWVNIAHAAAEGSLYFIAPACLLKKVATDHYQILSKQDSLTLIRMKAADITLLNAAKKNMTSPCGGFKNVTQAFTESANVLSTPQAFLAQHANNRMDALTHALYKIQYPKEVNIFLKQLNPQNLWNNLNTLTQFEDRYANSDNGYRAVNWIKTEIEKLKKEYHRADVTVDFFNTPGYKQPSLIVKIGNSKQPGIVIGAHMDTLSSQLTKKPGADDDGSGAVTILETARLLLSNQMQFKKPIYLMWYAAEEEGMIGSQAIVHYFKSTHLSVDAVLHFDMTGYAYRNDLALWIMQDYSSPALNNYLAQLITEYVKRPVSYSKCGYACSDHASWTDEGYPAAIAAEAAYEHSNPAIHSSRDTLDKLSLVHMTDYAKLAIAYVIELSEPLGTH